jgi:HEAT repeat protein
MSILDFLKPKKLPPGDPQTQKAGQKLISKNVDVQTRYAAADTLSDIGTEEAIFCLLHRFTAAIGTDSPDEDEKNNVFEKVRSFGSRSVPPIMKFLKEKEHAAHALKLLDKLSTPEEFLDRLLELTASFDPFHSKYPDKKIQTIKLLEQFKDARIIDALKDFLDDDDDDVRIATVRVLAGQENEDAARELLLQVIIESSERPRVRIAACEEVSNRKWRVAGFRKQIEDSLPAQFYLDSKGHVVTKPDYNPIARDE